MVVQHNMTAMNAERQLGLVTGRRAKATEKLSSGYKINRAADDAAGLSISEKMRMQVRGLIQASKNIEDGISLCKVADGALNETVDILQRMRELAVKSANGTNSEIDREFIEVEIAQLKREVDRIAKTTTFNEAIYPLNAPVTDEPEIEEPSPPDEPDPPPVVWDPDKSLIKEKTITFTTDRACTYDGKSYNVGDTITITGLTTNDKEVWVSGGVVIANNNPWRISGSNIETLKLSDLKADTDGQLYYVNRAGQKMYAEYAIISVDPDSNGNPDPLQFTSPKGAGGSSCRPVTVDDLSGKDPDPSEPDPPEPTEPDPPQLSAPNLHLGEIIYIQAGASTSVADKIPIYTVNATCEGIGITDVSVATVDSSGEALDILKEAMEKVSMYRTTFGATQNRLEHAKMIDDNVAENTQAAESAIRDTDIAEMMMEYSVNNILMQAGISMLSQANQSPQEALKLLAFS